MCWRERLLWRYTGQSRDGKSSFCPCSPIPNRALRPGSRPNSTIPIIVTLAHAATHDNDAQDRGDNQKTRNNEVIQRKIRSFRVCLQEQSSKTLHEGVSLVKDSDSPLQRISSF